MKKLNVGDRVRMIEKGQYSFDRIGNTGTVIGFASDKLLEITVDGEDHPIFGNGWTYWVENENWEVIEEESKMAKFKVGDKVVIKDNKNFHRFQNGDVVVITLIDCGTYGGHKVGDDPEEWWAFEDSEIEEYKEEVKVQKFKVGDKVRMVKLRSDGLSYSFDKIGNEGVVTGIGSGFIQVDVHCKGNTWEGNGWTYPLSNKCWELVEEEKEMSKCKFKVGDLVKGNDPRRYFYTNDRMGKGVVLEVHNHDDIRVKILEHTLGEVIGDAYNVDPQYFDFYEEPKLVQNEKPKIGDKVRVLKVDGNSPYSDHHWSVGDVAEVIQFAHGGKDTSIACHIDGRRYGYQTLIAGEYEVLG